MKDTTKKIDHIFITCPECSGSGRKNIVLNCSNCGGIGVGTFYNGNFFYWKPLLSLARIEIDKFREQVKLLINLIAFGIGLIGILCLFIWLYKTSTFSVRIEEFAFWRQRHPLLLVFWMTVFADLFIVYRISRDTLENKYVKLFKYDEQNKSSKKNNWSDLKNASSKEKIDVSEAYSNSAYKVVENAYILAKRLKHKNLRPIHLFFSCLESSEIAAVFSRLNVRSKELFEKIQDHVSDDSQTNNFTQISKTTRQALIDAYIDASALGQNKVTPKNILLSVIKYDKLLEEILIDFDVTENKVRNVIHWFSTNETQIASYKKFRSLAQFKPASNMDRAYTSVATPVLNNYGYDLTIAAKWNKLDFCVAREKEINEIWEHIEGGASGILLVGPEGVGKKTLMAGIAQKMVEEDVPLLFKDKRLMEIDVARLVSGAGASEAEGRLMTIVDEVNRAGNIILFIKDIESIVGITSGGEGSMDLSEVLSNAISRKILFAFASTTTESYLKYVEAGSIDQTMSKIDIDEPHGDQAIQIVESKISILEAKYGVYFSYNSIEQAVLFSDKYMHDSYLPKKALKILDIAAVRAGKGGDEFTMVTKDLVAEVVSEITEIPVTKISKNESEDLLNLEDKIHERMINQEEAVNAVAASLRRARTELREGVRPIANFLFLGPTGVGKTELAKSVTDIYFGDEKYMIRIDMSEYQHKDSVKKMIGDSSGTKGYLTEAVRKSPFSLVLLDEIEKANPEILNIFLQVMDDGRLTDGQGHTIDFTNSIIIATSNAGATYIQDEVYKGTDISVIRDNLINQHLNKIMRPELINRFDGVIVFEPLSQENIFQITLLMLKNIEKMLESKGIEMKVENEGVRILAKEGYDPKFGARPLRRLLQEKVENEIANLILANKLKRRDILVINSEAKLEVEKGVVL